MFTISKEFGFSASHELAGLPADHPCSRNHGHNYKVILVLQSNELNETGFVVDYRELKRFGEYIDQTLDHRFLNDVFTFQPSAELIAGWLYGWAKEQWPQTVEVRVSETDKTWASYRESVEHEQSCCCQ